MDQILNYLIGRPTEVIRPSGYISICFCGR